MKVRKAGFCKRILVLLALFLLVIVFSPKPVFAQVNHALTGAPSYTLVSDFPWPWGGSYFGYPIDLRDVARLNDNATDAPAVGRHSYDFIYNADIAFASPVSIDQIEFFYRAVSNPAQDLRVFIFDGAWTEVGSFNAWGTYGNAIGDLPAKSFSVSSGASPWPNVTRVRVEARGHHFIWFAGAWLPASGYIFEIRAFGPAIPNVAPNAVIDTPVGDPSIVVGDSVDFTGTGSDSDGVIVANSWTCVAAVGVCPVGFPFGVEDPGDVVFGVVGSYTITFDVQDDDGDWDPTPDTRTVTVAAPPPVCSVVSIVPDPVDLSVGDDAVVTVSYSNFSVLPVEEILRCGTGSGATVPVGSFNCVGLPDGTCTYDCEDYLNFGVYVDVFTQVTEGVAGPSVDCGAVPVTVIACGDGVTNGGEVCDIGLDGVPGNADDDDAACPGLCQAGCSCAAVLAGGYFSVAIDIEPIALEEGQNLTVADVTVTNTDTDAGNAILVVKLLDSVTHVEERAPASFLFLGIAAGASQSQNISAWINAPVLSRKNYLIIAEVYEQSSGDLQASSSVVLSVVPAATQPIPELGFTLLPLIGLSVVLIVFFASGKKQ